MSDNSNISSTFILIFNHILPNLHFWVYFFMKWTVHSHRPEEDWGHHRGQHCLGVTVVFTQAPHFDSKTADTIQQM